MVDVILVSPTFSPSFYPSPGLGYLASYLKSCGFSVEVVYPFLSDLDIKGTAHYVVKKDPKMVGISCLTMNRYDAYKLANLIKVSLSNSKMVAGGPHVTPLDLITLSRAHFDAVVRGEGEHTLAEYVDFVMKDLEPTSCLGLTYKQGSSYKRNDNRPPIKNLDELPFPDYESFYSLDRNRFSHVRVYLKAHDHIRLKSTPIVTSRGCPYRCIFCSSSRIWGRFYRSRSPENVVEEIEEHVQKYKAKHIRFFDDHFTLHRRRAIEICKAIMKRGLDIFWYVETRPDSVSRALLREMKRAGCYAVEYGMESGSNQILENIRKGITIDQIQTAIKATKEEGLLVVGNFIGGSPNETISDFLNTLKLAERCDIAYFYPLMIFPGSEIYEDMKKEGRLNDDIWFSYRHASSGTLFKDVPVYTESFSIDQLDLMQKIFRNYILWKKKSMNGASKLVRSVINLINWRRNYKKLIKNLKLHHS